MPPLVDSSHRQTCDETARQRSEPRSGSRAAFAIRDPRSAIRDGFALEIVATTGEQAKRRAEREVAESQGHFRHPALRLRARCEPADGAESVGFDDDLDALEPDRLGVPLELAW